MGLDTDGHIEKIKIKYDIERHYSGVKIHENNKKRETAFIAMLDWFFSHKEVPKEFLKKNNLKILDVGCGRMLYAFPLKLFFEHAGKKRKIYLLGIDTEIAKTNVVSEELVRRGIQNIDVHPLSIEELPVVWYDVITCFNCSPTSDPDSFFKRIAKVLPNDGIFLMSFLKGSEEMDKYKDSIKNAGLKIRFGVDNPFRYKIVNIGPGYSHSYLCIATKEPL